MTSPEFGGHRRRFLQRFPDAANLEKALRTESNPDPFFYFSESDDPDLRGCWWILCRLGTELEKQFSIASEILMLFTLYEDLQRRSFNALIERVRGEVSRQQTEKFGSVRFTPDPSVAFLWAPDSELAMKLEAWNLQTAGSLAAPTPSLQTPIEHQKNMLATSLHTVLAARDLYRGRNPVTGNDFFGRSETLLTLRTELSSGRSVGLFGLRRSGKTSVIREFRRRGRSSGLVVVLSDLETIGDLGQAPGQVTADLTNALRTLRENDSNIWLGPEGEHSSTNHSEMSARIIRAAEKNRQLHFVLALDEIESLVPLVEKEPQEVRLFLGALRRAAQTADNVSLLLTGVTTRFFDQSMLAPGVENPLFGFVEAQFLMPFKPEESHNLIRKLGRAMMLKWDDEALQTVHETAGGFPFLVRDLASAVRGVAMGDDTHRAGTAPIEITKVSVSRATADWTEGACLLWSEIVRTLESHHPLMAEMIRCSTDDELSEWMQVGAEAQAAAKSLEALGMLTRGSGSWTRSDTLRSLQSLGSSPKVEFTAVRADLFQRTDDAERVRRLAALPESDSLEFKATGKVNTATGLADKRIEEAVTKTVAGFLNSSGGTLLIGVGDDGSLVGIDRDLHLFKESIDKYALFLRSLFTSNLGASNTARLIEIGFPVVEGVVIAEIKVSPAAEPVWCQRDGADTLYVRSGNQTQALPNRELHSYITARFVSR